MKKSFVQLYLLMIGLSLFSYNCIDSSTMKKSPEIEFKNFINDLRHIRIEPTSYVNISEIKKINIAHCQTGELPPYLERMPYLEELYLSGNNIRIINESLWKVKSLKKLFLFSNKLEKVDENIQQLINLEELNISSNEIVELPDGLGKLENLYVLSLSKNKFKILPPSIANLKKLKDLQLRQVDDLNLGNLCKILSDYKRAIHLGSYDNNINTHGDFLQISISRIESLPDEIGLLQSLQKLYLPFAKVPRLPLSLFDLPSISHLNLRNNNITEIPEEIKKLNSLSVIDLRCNKIKKLPRSIGELTNLEELHFHQNLLTEIPDEIGNLSSLKKLDLSNNNLTQIPTEIVNLSFLEELNLSSNKLANLPIGLQNLKNLKQLWLVDNDLSEKEKNRIKESLPDCFILFEQDERTAYLRPQHPILKKGIFKRNSERSGYFLVEDKNNKEYYVKLSGKQRMHHITFKEGEIIYFLFDNRTTEGLFVNGTNFKMNQNLFGEKIRLDNEEKEN